MVLIWFVFFFQAEDGIRDIGVTGVQTCALPISVWAAVRFLEVAEPRRFTSSKSLAYAALSIGSGPSTVTRLGNTSGLTKPSHGTAIPVAGGCQKPAAWGWL